MQQQEIYDQLRQDAETHTIHGYTVIISQGNAGGMNEELSTVAHKMRDLLDPDAILLLIEIRGGIQLIARSTSDQIDVSQIAGYFGGGGHRRAAAALIKSGTITDIHNQLMEILPKFVKPGVIVDEIMSRTPQILNPATPVQEIYHRMQRYGYEGYPVVENNQIVGLVTRRAVDRALSHKLNLTAFQLMEAGKVHVHADHSIEYLQNVMTETGWGQIPVVDRDNHQVVGIVTRTDLLKTLAPQVPIPGHLNLTDKLEFALPAQRLVLLKDIATIALDQRVAIYIVGGFVRDLLLDRPSLDFDIVVEGDAIELAEAIQNQFGGRITTHKRFGTAKWFLSETHKDAAPTQAEAAPLLPDTLDFITARTEFYTQPTALPTVERGSIKLDLHRRDFTINTLALRLDGHHFGELYDYWGGYNDLRHGLVRILHSLSFIDDPTRILRAVRYEQRYDFSMGERTQQLLLEARSLISRISGDRVRHEIDNILAEDRATQMLERLKNLQILEEIHPDLKWDDWIASRLNRIILPTPEWALSAELKGQPFSRVLAYAFWLMRLSPARAKSVTKRLRVASIIAETVQSACVLWQKLPELKDGSPSECVSILDKAKPAAIYAVFCATEDETLRQKLLAYITQWRFVSPEISGHDLQARGLSPGPHYKTILNELRRARLDGQISTSVEERQLADELIAEIKNGTA
jgi:tRNA nucleotidyltransferase (CCA-adding enzyme)